MNPHSHDHARSLGPCEDFEFDLVERSEGALDPARALIVQQHLEHCSRCRAHAAALAELDAALAGALPRPQLSQEFDARLEARIAALRQVPNRAAAIADAEQEHQQMLLRLGRGVTWRTLLNAVALGSVAGGVMLGLDSFAPGLLRSLDLVPAGISASAAFSIVLGVVFLVSGVIFARRPGGTLLLAD
jgi:predicted anti-sigma-YlaC factor YlaD